MWFLMVLSLQLVHAGLIMKGTLAKRGRQCSALKKTADEAVAEKNVAEERLKVVEGELRKMVEERNAAESQAKMSLAEADSQAQKVSDLESELAIMRADLEAEVAAKRKLQAELGEERAENTKKQRELNEAASKSAKQGTLLQSLSDQLATAERGIEVAKVDAVETFKDIQAFADAVAECSADSYRLGFADCKEATSKFYPNLDFSAIHLPGGEESSEEEALEEEEPEEERVEQGIADFVDGMLEAIQADEPASAVPSSVEAEEDTLDRHA